MLALRLILIVAIPISLTLASTLLSEPPKGSPLAIKMSLTLTVLATALAAMRLIERPTPVKLLVVAICGAVLGFIWNFSVTLIVWSFSFIAAFGLLIAIVGALAGMIAVAWREASLSTADVIGCALSTLIALTVNTLRSF